jgi:hypothetical protein
VVNPANRLAAGLAAAAAVWCVVYGILLLNSPIMSGGRTPFLIEAFLMIVWPLAACGCAVWAAVAGRPIMVALFALLVGAFSVVTGFSIGRGVLPAVGLLVWAIVASAGSSVARSR